MDFPMDFPGLRDAALPVAAGGHRSVAALRRLCGGERRGGPGGVSPGAGDLRPQPGRGGAAALAGPKWTHGSHGKWMENDGSWGKIMETTWKTYCDFGRSENHGKHMGNSHGTS